MPNLDQIELFILKCPSIEAELRKALGDYGQGPSYDIEKDDSISEYVGQFELDVRVRARQMAEYYKLFYMLENDIRRIISEVLETNHGTKWWDSCVDQPIKDEVEKNKKREADAGISLRSDSPLDYTTFGQLGEIIKKNWSDVAGMLSNQSALSRVSFQLNMLRGAIAHCGFLADDEVDRLKLTIKDWFRLLGGPAA
jgi:hypothetical protein